MENVSDSLPERQTANRSKIPHPLPRAALQKNAKVLFLFSAFHMHQVSFSPKKAKNVKNFFPSILKWGRGKRGENMVGDQRRDKMVKLRHNCGEAAKSELAWGGKRRRF